MRKIINFLLLALIPLALITIIIFLARILTVDDNLFDESEIYS
ncbi:hypothetical protein JGI3_01380 [Candidatus Kryptobacter tengchongensis]|uniref:Uncharacterized protein n=1 Tax=Kryptobacter tengchongensis TaxID=1643429 RepID=A0A656DE82_KRYT1|nr:hypothetical protein [Candidatus Kryptobacter tengchongensis]CUS84263.1 hypothetical protein JGI20_00895 [Candidatus Kryptobacter tengchongensis]CUS98474.1 hypothetical protein JGI24_00454 [Candidatus Kryptobacter tengchongensis]CUU02721.1 hypothetical protein JGI2_00885 [Candidatus Kryptobacter tengchongensis]CUU06795.1 hypothetical protein JGI3_01380 [Candidatus Kryptobacter tengchongensis]